MVREEAISNFRGESELKLDGGGGSAGSGMHSISPKKSGESVTVPVETIDSLVTSHEIPPPNVIQMDVEGEEYHVVEGAISSLSRDDCRLIHIQVHRNVIEGNQLSDYDIRSSELVTLLEKCGFEVTYLDKNHTNGYLIGRK